MKFYKNSATTETLSHLTKIVRGETGYRISGAKIVKFHFRVINNYYLF